MNWLILIIAGLFEVGFASCTGKAKETTGAVSWYWLSGFFVCLTISMVLLYKAAQTLPSVQPMPYGRVLVRWELY